MAAVTLAFEDGTLRVTSDTALDPDALSDADLDIEYDPRSETMRAPAFRYAALRDALDAAGHEITDNVLALPALDLDSTYRLREYQQDALDAWQRGDGNAGSGPPERGVLELPTGSGKTVIGIAAMEALDVPTLVVVPTIDLLTQWRDELTREFDCPVGQLGGGEQRVEDVTVATYDSAYLRAAELGDRFGLVVFDEVHHLGGEGYRDIARLLAAPARLGLTATFERPDGAHEVVAALLGPLVHRIGVDDLAGEHLADYDIKRLTVALTDEERAVYERHQSTFTDYLASSNIQLRSGSDYQELVKRSGTDPRARAALLAKQRAREVTMNAERKVERLAEILDRHRTDRVLVFTASTDLVYRLSERFLIPAITHETGADERETILQRFRDGTYSRVVTANVLDEGVDVPACNVGVLLAGSGSQREFTQRLGRILRPKDGEEGAGRALLYELVTEDTTEERVARRRR
ncbi:MAG: DEAD/DEAH box helicase family protein [Haloarculaceae archaeon]